ncbi:hypothetical protein JOD82_001616 [Paenibacillus sp. 1182]|jgi:hypothetical protein|nr:hypothetical protein [Paenibacillus sp. 1182]
MNRASQQILKPLKRQTDHKSERGLLFQRLFNVVVIQTAWVDNTLGAALY